MFLSKLNFSKKTYYLYRPDALP